jgi:hypothetical protein
MHMEVTTARTDRIPAQVSKRALLWPWGYGLMAALALTWAPQAGAQETTIQRAPNQRSTQIIIRQRPTTIRNPSIIVVPPYPLPRREDTQVRVELDAQGRDWGTVYLNGRIVHQPGNFDRQKTLYLPQGGYRLEITGVVRSDRWASGYLDLGRDNSRLVVVRFSREGGVSVSGSPYVWIPD